MHTTWILIASASAARLFKAKKNCHDMELIQEFYHPENREKVQNLISDAPGRYRKSVSPKSAFEAADKDPKKIEAERFAHMLASILDKGRTNNLYSNLVVIAPAHFQGLLNRTCNHFVMEKISETLDKDYTKVREHDLPKYLNGWYFGKKVA